MSDKRPFPKSGFSRDRESQPDYLAPLQKQIGAILEFSEAPNLAGLIDDIKKFCEFECKELKAHQLRRLFDEVRKKTKASQIQLLRSKFAYAMARQTSRKSKSVIEFFDQVMSRIVSDDQVKEFRLFFEAVVAYHKFFHGSN